VLVGPSGGKRKAAFTSAATGDHGRVGLLNRCRRIPVRRPLLMECPELALEHGHALTQGQERNAVPAMLVLVPAGADTDLDPALTSLTGADQTTCATVRLWPTAYRFKRGHRIRIQVSSGAFPRYNRNPGTDEPRATAAVLRAADQQVHHDSTHPSTVILPVKTGI
jgi:hypothetical protein